jgi:hypothetical protein
MHMERGKVFEGDNSLWVHTEREGVKKDLRLTTGQPDSDSIEYINIPGTKP